MEFEDLVGLEEEDLLEHIFRERAKGYSSGEIFESITSRGLTEEEAVQILFRANEKASKKIEEGNHAIILGVFLILAGIGIRLISKTGAAVNVVDIISYCLLVYGGLKVINGWFKLSTYGKWRKK